MMSSKLSLFARPAIRQMTRPKSSYVYSYDKTFAQKWVEGRVKKINQLQKLYAAEDGNPLWWKTGADKALTVTVGAMVAVLTVQTLHNAYSYAVYGKLD